MTIRLLQGDALAVLRTLPSESVHCVVTSPPYYGLRDYGTATWEGGDPACGHTAPDEAGKTGKPTAGQRQHAGRFAGPQCWKCGARRIDQQIGLEGTPEAYLARLVEVFREVRRVLRRDGVCFVNLGDNYASSSTYNAPRSMHSAAGWKQVGRGPNASVAGATKEHWTGGDPNCAHPPEKRGDKWNYAFDPKFCKCGARMRLVKECLVGAKPKDLLMMPFRLALALQADGWWLRSVMPWVKRSCMPESCRDRPTSAIEYVFMLTRSERYFWDAEAVRQAGTIAAGTLAAKGSAERAKHANGRPPEYAVYSGQRNFRNSDLFFASLDQFSEPLAADRQEARQGEGSARSASAPLPTRRSRSKHSGWFTEAERRYHTHGSGEPSEPLGLMLDENGDPLALDVNPMPFKEAHFATFPPRLVEPLVKAGTSERGCCPMCGAPWARIVERQSVGDWRTSERSRDLHDGARGGPDGVMAGWRPEIPVGWRPTCACPPADPVPCTVLDPFSGSGTTLLVADRLQRHAIGIDLNPQYYGIASERVTGDAPLLAEMEGVA